MSNHLNVGEAVGLRDIPLGTILRDDVTGPYVYLHEGYGMADNGAAVHVRPGHIIVALHPLPHPMDTSLALFKQRFTTVALAAGVEHSVRGVPEALRSLGLRLLPDAPMIGHYFGQDDEDMLEALPSGTVVRSVTPPGNLFSFTAVVDRGSLQRISGSLGAVPTNHTCLQIIDGPGLDRVDYQIERETIEAWVTENLRLMEEAQATYSWCGVFNRVLSALGVDERVRTKRVPFGEHDRDLWLAVIRDDTATVFSGDLSQRCGDGEPPAPGARVYQFEAHATPGFIMHRLPVGSTTTSGWVREEQGWRPSYRDAGDLSGMVRAETASVGLPSMAPYVADTPRRGAAINLAVEGESRVMAVGDEVRSDAVANALPIGTVLRNAGTTWRRFASGWTIHETEVGCIREINPQSWIHPTTIITLPS